MVSHAHAILATNSTVEAREAEASRNCTSRHKIDGSRYIYMFADGSSLRGAHHTSEFINALTTTEGVS